MGKPYTDYVQMCKLDMTKGNYIGKTYITDRYCQKFIKAIADTCRDQQRELTRSADFIAIMSDDSTDCSTTETEIVYLRISVHCEVNFINILEIKFLLPS